MTRRAVLFVASLVFLLPVTQLLAPHTLTLDQLYYFRIAKEIVNHGAIAFEGRPTAYVTPGYPGFVSVFVLLAGNGFVRLLVAAQAVALALTGLVCREIVRQLRGSRGAQVLAQLFVVLYPPFIIAAASVLTETLFILSVVVLFMLWGRLVEDQSTDEGRVPTWLWWAIGISTVAAVSLRPTAVLFLAALLIAAIVAWRLRVRILTRRTLAALAVCAVAVALFVGVWGARNYRAMGQFVPFSSEGYGVAFFGNQVASRGEGNLGTIAKTVGVAEAERITAMHELERQAAYRRALLSEIREHPRQVAALLPVKLERFWLNLGFGDPPSTSSRVLGAANVLLFLCAVGGILLRRGRALEAWCVIAGMLTFCVLLMCVHLATFSTVRYSYPADALLMCLAAIFVAAVLRRGRGLLHGRTGYDRGLVREPSDLR
jgi:hypothetical protein